MKTTAATRNDSTRLPRGGSRRPFICVALVAMLAASFGRAGGQETKCTLSELSDDERAACLLSLWKPDNRLRDFYDKARTLYALLDGRGRKNGRFDYGASVLSSLPMTERVRAQIDKLLRRYHVSPLNLRARAGQEYFVIHDVTPVSEARRYTPGRTFDNTHELFFNPVLTNEDDLRGWWYSGWLSVYINRAGESTPAMVLTPPRLLLRRPSQIDPDTTYNVGLLSARRRLDIEPWDKEAIQARSYFTKAQMLRLSLIYMGASSVAGKWLVPAYHSEAEANATCPANFNLIEWDGVLSLLVRELEDGIRAAQLEDFLSASLNRKSSELQRQATLLAPVRVSPSADGPAKWYNIHDVRALFIYNKRELIQDLNYTDFFAMRDYVQKYFPVPSKEAGSRRPEPARPADYVDAAFRPAQDEEVPESWVKSALKEASNFYAKLMKSKSAVDIKVASQPEGASVMLKTSRGVVRQIDTNSSFNNIFLGLYTLEIRKEGYAPISRPLDLVNEEGAALTCWLYARQTGRCILK